MSSPPKVDFKELIPEVRQQIKEKCESDPDNYDQVDIDRVGHDDWSVLRFIKDNRGDISKTVDHLDSNLKWRHDFGVNTRAEGDLPIEFVKAGALFPCGVDHMERPVIYMRAKVYRNIPQLQEIFKQFVVGVINRVDTEAGPNGYTLVFDLNGVGLANANMDFLKFLINTMRNQFPYGLRFVLVYNQPFILRPLWTIAKLWLGPHQKFIKFVSGDAIKELIAEPNLPRYLGGESQIDFTVAPEGCKPVKELAQKYGFSDSEVDSYMKIFEPHINEAKKLVGAN